MLTKIAAILNEWSAALQRGPTETGAIEKALSATFSGYSFTPAESRVIRPGPSLEIRDNKFAGQIILQREAFLQSVRSAMRCLFENINPQNSR